jgi:hypothetical protein
MPLSEVTTPDGKMPVAGHFRPFAASLVDLYLATLILSIIGVAVGASGPISAVFGVGAFSYAFLGHRMLVPSLGAWALGLRRYPCKVIEEYSDRGSLFVYERLASNVYSRRTIICVLVLALLHLVAYFVVRGAANGSA